MKYQKTKNLFKFSSKEDTKMPTITPVLSEYISLNEMESTSNRVALFYIQFSPQAVRLARLRGGGSPAPGKSFFGSGEQAVRLRGEKRSVSPLIISALQRQTLVFRTV